jgi:ankyrin repeat protein
MTEHEEFITSCLEGNLESVKYFVEKDNFLQIYSDLVCCASENGHLEVVKYLVEKGADFRALGNVQIPLAHQAMFEDMLECWKIKDDYELKGNIRV